MKYPKVSVIIPCFNAEKWVAHAIQSVLNQDYPNLEVIVIDDGSADNSLDVIRSFGDRIRWETGPNRGACAARNRGLALTTAEYVMFLDADDWLVPGIIAKLVARSLELPPDTKTTIFGQVIQTNAEGCALGSGQNPWVGDGERASDIWIMLDGPRTTTVLHQHRYLIEIGGFNPSLPSGQEFDLHIRLMQGGMSFIHYAVPVYYYRQHESPDRISNNRKIGRRYWKCSDASTDVEHVYRWAVVEQSRVLDQRERAMIANYAWGLGRKLLRHGVADGKDLLDLAKRVSPEDHIVGSFAYRITCALLGPIWSERIGMARSSCRSIWRGTKWLPLP